MNRWTLIIALTMTGGGLSFAFMSRANEAQGPAKAGKTAPNKITKVTVYPNSAVVTREVVVPEGEGLSELIVPNLPPQTLETSLYSEGAEGIRILSTRFNSRLVEKDTREEVRKFQEQIKQLQMEGEKTESDLAALQLNAAMVTKLENFTEKTAVGTTEKAMLNSETVIKLATYLMDKRAEISKKTVELQQDKKANQEKISFLQNKMREVGIGTNHMEREAIIVVDRQKNAGGPIRLNYMVGSASWQPQYKFRAGKAGEEVKVDYLATMFQETGEDWSNVELTLSTAQPTLNATPPHLRKLEVSLAPRGAAPGTDPGGPGDFALGSPYLKDAAKELSNRAKILRSQASENQKKKQDKEAEESLNEAGAYDQTRELVKSREEIHAELQSKLPKDASEEGPSVTYHLQSKITVPSRNNEQIVEIAKLGMVPKIYYKTIPVLSRQVYRLADLVNKGDFPLLPGEATMYQGTDFVGRMTLPLVAVSEQFTVGFGVDPQLQVQRKMLDKTKSQQGGNQVLKYEYRILVNSYKAEPVKLQVWDRLPHAETETANISLMKTTPELSKDELYLRERKPLNLLRWDLEILPNQNNEKAVSITYEFKIELDRMMTIRGFQSGQSLVDLPAFERAGASPPGAKEEAKK